MKLNHEHLPSKVAVIGTLAGVALWDVFCKDGETWSEGVDRFIEKHPVATPLAIGYTALHLANMLPERLDLFHQATKIKTVAFSTLRTQDKKT